MRLNRWTVCGTCLPLALIVTRCNSAPIQSHKTATYAEDMCGGQCIWSASGAETGELTRYNHLVLSLSAILWNGVAIERPTLNDYLTQVRALNSVRSLGSFSNLRPTVTKFSVSAAEWRIGGNALPRGNAWSIQSRIG